MKPLTWLLTPALALLLGVPLGAALLIAAVTTPAAAIPPACLDRTRQASAAGLPGPGEPRRASLTNPPTPIPADVQALYEQAGAAYGLPWTLLAGIGMAETNHGRLTATSSAGAQGFMQFLPATFATYGVDGDHDGVISIDDDADSIHTAAAYLVVSGALTGADGVRAALYAYNHAGWYVNDVLYYAAAYTGDDLAADPCLTANTNTTNQPVTAGTGPASAAVNAALQWIGTPYSWGGGNSHGPTTGICCSPGGQDARHTVGFDCSGLVLYAYAQIGIPLPHLAHDITYNSGGQVIPRDLTVMKPGDVIGFSYTPGGHVFHVGIYLGNGTMINSDSNGVSVDTLTTGYYNRLAWHIVRFTAVGA